MKRFRQRAFLGLIIATLDTGCAKLPEAQQQDVANIVGGIGGKNSNPSFLTRESPQDLNPPQGMVDLIQQQMSGSTWLALFKLETGQLSLAARNVKDALAPFDSTNCPATTTQTEGVSCTISCPSASQLLTRCTTSGTSQNTCNQVVYTFSNQTASVTIDLTGVTESASDYTGTFNLALDFSADINGGNLTGKTLACNLGFTFDIAKAKAETPQTPTLDCSNFSCTYDGITIDCQTLQSKFASGMSCS